MNEYIISTKDFNRRSNLRLRSCHLESDQLPTRRTRLQWVDGEHFVGVTWNGGQNQADHVPVCGFERSAHKVPVPDKSLNTVGTDVRLAHSSSRRSSTHLDELLTYS